MKFLSICSGIDAASVAWASLGWKAIGFSEIEPYPCSVLKHHYPNVPNFGDMVEFETWPESILADVDLIVGGAPCQAFSVAGARKGLDDARGNLTLVYAKLIDHVDAIRRKYNRPEVIVIYENVSGLLSDKTNAFGCLIGALAGEESEIPNDHTWSNVGCAYGPKRAIAWRVLDAQYFGVAQRRRRVFVVASARNGFDPASILFEFDGVRRDIAPQRETGKEVTGTIGACAFGGNNTSGPIDVATACNASPGGRMDFESETLIVCSVALRVRRLTPVEYERLQGFPDSYTQVSHRGKAAADGPRYKALGNSMAVPCMAWIGRRIA